MEEVKGRFASSLWKISDQADYVWRLFSLKYDLRTNFETFVWNYHSAYKLLSETTSEQEIISSLIKQPPHPYNVILYPIYNFEVLIEHYNECRDSGLWDKLAGNSASRIENYQNSENVMVMTPNLNTRNSSFKQTERVQESHRPLHQLVICFCYGQIGHYSRDC